MTSGTTINKMRSDSMNDLLEESIGLLKQANESYGKDLVYPTSLGLSGSVLIYMIATYVPSIRIVTIDTGKLPGETIQAKKELEAFCGVEIEVLHPDTNEVRDMVDCYGDELYMKSVELRKMCCEIRKVRVLQRALRGKAWITGRRQDQSPERKNLDAIETDPNIGICKFNPLLRWSVSDIRAYTRQVGVPYNSMYDEHFASIGCAPCTRPISVGEPERNGRWWWESGDAFSECGLHMDPIKAQRDEKV